MTADVYRWLIAYLKEVTQEDLPPHELKAHHEKLIDKLSDELVLLELQQSPHLRYHERLAQIATEKYPIVKKNCASERRSMLYLRNCYIEKMVERLKNL